MGRKGPVEKKIIHYEDKRGRQYVKEFINSFDEKTRGKITARIEFLIEHWQEMRRPLVDKIDEDLYELRVQFAWNNIRVIYAYMFKNYIVLLHGFRKKTDRVLEGDKMKARNRMMDFQARYNNGQIKLP